MKILEPGEGLSLERVEMSQGKIKLEPNQRLDNLEKRIGMLEQRIEEIFQINPATIKIRDTYLTGLDTHADDKIPDEAHSDDADSKPTTSTYKGKKNVRIS